MTPVTTTASSPFASMNLSTAQQMQRRAGHAHSVLPEGNTSTTAGNGTGAMQSFASILGGITNNK